jgi:uncharacterized membrane protein (UPF0182 family)
VITAVVLLGLFIALTTFSSLWTERLWFAALDYSGVFSTLLWTQVGLFLVFGGLMAATVAVNIAVAYRFRPFLTAPDPAGLDRYREAVLPIRGWLLAGLSLVMGLFAGMSATGQWRNYSLWRGGVEFGKSDPYFGRDMGWFISELPWWHYLVDYAMALAVIGLMAAALVHYLYGGIRLSGPGDKLSGAAQVQLSVLLGIFVLAKAGDYWLDRYDLVSGGGGLFTGMGYTDDNAVLPAKEILVGIAVVCAVLFFLNVWRRTWMLPSMGIALMALSAIILGMIWPGVVQQFRVSPSEPDREGPYIAENIKATRDAYGLSGIEVTPYVNEPTLEEGRFPTLNRNTSSVPLVDPKIVSETFEQQQQVRAYYSVPPVLDVDHYEIEGEERAVVLGVRELDQSGIADSNRNWANLHTVYTHGNGVIAAYANQRPTDDRRQAGDIQWAEGQEASESDLSNLGSDGYESRVYFGELSPSYSIVGKPPGGKDVEIDLPKGERSDENTTTTYDGAGGVPVGNLFSKLLYAVKFGEPNLLLSDRVHEDSKILYDRHPREMVEKVAPWLTVDADPYPAVIDGRIQWILDGYTVTDRYPNSQLGSFEEMTDDSRTEAPGFQTLPTDEVNYLRNAVKATVDAYDGTVRLYEWDEEDPILQAWRRIFPGTVQPKEEIPESVLKHLRYPEDLFKVQRYHFARYHETVAREWYDGNSRWEVPEDPYATGRFQAPYRLFVNQDGEKTYSLTTVYVPRGRANLVSFMSVNTDATSSDYGRFEVLELPNERTDGPSQIASKLSSDEDIRQQLLSFSVGNIKPVYGNLLTLPVGDGLMYVQPLYAQRDASETSFPILRFALVSYGGRIGIGNTLTQAIADVLGVDPEAVEDAATGGGGKRGGDAGGDDRGSDGGSDEGQPGGVDAQIADLLAQAEQKYTAADEAQAQGDTVRWAQLMQEARELIDQAVELAGSR